MALIDQGWEYRRISSWSANQRRSSLEIEVNELGHDGWEVFDVHVLDGVEIVWLRRRLTKWVGSDVD